MFVLSSRSRRRLDGVDQKLIEVVERAIVLTEVDFTVLQGLRTLEQQRTLVTTGSSQTMNSKHLTGEAVDVGAWVGGSVRWDWPLYPAIAEAFQEAAEELQVSIRWGGCWGRLDEMDDIHDAMRDYVVERRTMGQKPFLDGGHFELFRED